MNDNGDTFTMHDVIDVGELDPRAAPPDDAEPARKPGRPKGSKSRRSMTRNAIAKRKRAAERKAAGEAPPVPDDGAVPASLRGRPSGDRAPKRRPAPQGEAPDLRAQIATMLGVANTAFTAIVPDTCAPAIPPELRGSIHLATCSRMWALSEDEVARLSDAIAQELEAHPDTMAKMAERFATWAPHVALITVAFAIVANRVQRQAGEVLQVAELSPPQTALLAGWLARQQGQAEPEPAPERGAVERVEPEPWSPSIPEGDRVGVATLEEAEAPA